jgi:hypothetical protein
MRIFILRLGVRIIAKRDKKVPVLLLHLCVVVVDRSRFIQFWKRPNSFDESVQLFFGDVAMQRRKEWPVDVFVAAIEFLVTDGLHFRRFAKQERLKPASIADGNQKWPLPLEFGFRIRFLRVRHLDRLIEDEHDDEDEDDSIISGSGFNLLNALALWNTRYTNLALNHLRSQGLRFGRSDLSVRFGSNDSETPISPCISDFSPVRVIAL